VPCYIEASRYEKVPGDHPVGAQSGVAGTSAGGQKEKRVWNYAAEQADQILDELRQIRELLEKGARPDAEPGSGIRMNLEDGPGLAARTRR